MFPEVLHYSKPKVKDKKYTKHKTSLKSYTIKIMFYAYFGLAFVIVLWTTGSWYPLNDLGSFIWDIHVYLTIVPCVAYEIVDS